MVDNEIYSFVISCNLFIQQYEWLVGAQYKPMELVKSDWAAIRKSPPWAIDSWGLGKPPLAGAPKAFLFPSLSCCGCVVVTCEGNITNYR